MIRPGICSVTLAEQPPQEVLKTAIEAGLQGIEWWGTGHVPHGDIDTARRVGEQTRAAGLEVPSYGSYYRAGVSEAEGLSFVSVLDTAEALGAPMIRIWAGNQNGIDADATHVQAVIDDTLRIADLADGKARWQAFFDAARASGRDHWALLEFVKDNSREQVVKDAAALVDLIRN